MFAFFLCKYVFLILQVFLYNYPGVKFSYGQDLASLMLLFLGAHLQRGGWEAPAALHHCGSRCPLSVAAPSPRESCLGCPWRCQLHTCARWRGSLGFLSIAAEDLTVDLPFPEELGRYFCLSWPSPREVTFSICHAATGGPQWLMYVGGRGCCHPSCPMAPDTPFVLSGQCLVIPHSGSGETEGAVPPWNSDCSSGLVFG